MRFLYHLDTILTESDLETLAVGLLLELPLPVVETAVSDSGIIWEPVTQAAADQKSVKTVTESTRKTYSDNYTFEQLHTVSADELADLASDHGNQLQANTEVALRGALRNQRAEG